ncbi:MAG: hypothetical protein EOP83_05720 [Verrucomicrobiaceae bacterium]|nr:MAG: hypothetical protein EOP83_05720 [Verrucomicrobiaceae bacterium]
MMSFSMMVGEILIGLICLPLVISGNPQAVLFGLCTMGVSFTLAYYEGKRCIAGCTPRARSVPTTPSWATTVILPASANTTANATTLNDPNWDAEQDNKWF